MAEVTLVPNDTDCRAFHGSSTTVPDTVAHWRGLSALSGGELDNISTKNDVYQTQVCEGGPPNDEGAIQVEYKWNVALGTITNLAFKFDCNNSGGNVGVLKCWDNAGAGAWMSVDEYIGGEPGDYILQGSPANPDDDYVDGGGYIVALIYMTAGTCPGNQIELDKAELTITYTAPVIYDETGLRTTVLAVTSCTDTKKYLESISTTVLVASSATDKMKYAESVVTVVTVATSCGDRQTYIHSTSPTVVLAVTEATDQWTVYETGLSTTVLVVTSCNDTLIEYTESLSTTVLVVTSHNEVMTFHESVGTTVLVITSVSDVKAAETESVGTTVLVVTTCTDNWIRHESRATTVLVITSCTDVLKTKESVGTTVLVVTSCTDVVKYIESLSTTVLVETDAWSMLVLPMLVSIPRGNRRQLRWTADNLPEGSDFVVLTDGGHIYGPTTRRSMMMSRDLEIREFIQVVHLPTGFTVDDLIAHAQTPLDCVRMNWSDVSAAAYHIERKLGAGSWSVIDSVLELTYLDGPLEDGSYTHRIIAEDAEGDQSTCSGKTSEVQAPPNPPSAITWSFTGGTLTVDWTASTSADVLRYAILRSAGDDELDLSVEAAFESDTDYSQVFTTETGTYIFLVRTEDTSGNRESNLSQMVAIPFLNGIPAGYPADPQSISAVPSEGGRVTVEWAYFPSGESGVGVPGVAHEARIYYDNGTGVIDYSSPLGTLAMSLPTTAGTWSYVTPVLSDDQPYQFVVRIATAASPGGLETTNSTPVGATPNSDQPDVVTLEVEVV